MKTYFGYMFWGLLLVILHICINGFDLLPDGLGYVLVATGCSGLTSLSPRFSTAKALCWALAILWVVGFAVRGDAGVIYGVATMVINCIMMWMLLGGIIEFARARNRIDLANSASNRRVAYVVLAVAAALLGVVARGSRDFAIPLVLIIVVSMLAVVVMILHLIYRVRSELAT